MWTGINCLQYDRSGLRYASDLTDGEWDRSPRIFPPANDRAAPGRRTYARC